MTHYVYSTLSVDMEYCSWAKTNDVPVLIGSVLIKGGANVSKEIEKNYFKTLEGYVTVVDDAQLAILEQDTIFNLHRNNGFIKVDKKQPVEKAVSSMTKKDKSAPPKDSDELNNLSGARPNQRVEAKAS